MMMRIGIRRLPLMMGSVLGVTSYHTLLKSKPIYNDTLYRSSPLTTSTGTGIQQQTPRYDGAFGGRLNYQELSIGSFVGLFTGIIIGKLSHVLWFASLGCYLLIQWLQARHVIDIKMSRMVKLGTRQIDVQRMVFERPSFSVSFVLLFLISAWNV